MTLPTVGLLFDNFGPYHLARLRGALKAIDRKNVVGLQMHGRSVEYAWKPADAGALHLPLQTIFPPGEAPLSPARRISHVWCHLDRLRPAAVAIAGYAAWEMVAALAWCRWNRCAAILVSESKADDTQRFAWKEALKGWLVRRYDAALVGGHPQRRYIEGFGIPKEAVFTQINVVGNDEYHPDLISALPRPVPEPFFLTVNRFIPKKNLRFVLDCYGEYRARMKQDARPAWSLVLAGDGELRPELEAHACALGCRESVLFPGFLQQSELLPYLAHCAVFLHASTAEQWGLVVNEAMAAGRPVFVSRKCGCFEDLIHEGKTGLGFAPDRAEELIDLMVRATTGQIPLAALGAAGLAHIGNYSPVNFGHTLDLATDFAIERARRRSRFCGLI